MVFNRSKARSQNNRQLSGCTCTRISNKTRLIGPFMKKIVSKYDQEIPKSQTTDNPEAPRGRAAQPSRDTRKTN